VLVGEGRAPRSSGAPPDSVQVDHVPLKAIPATHAAEEEAQVDRARLQAIEAAIQSGHWIRSHEGRTAQGLESLRWTLPSRQGLEEAGAEAATPAHCTQTISIRCLCRSNCPAHNCHARG
jgi:hypothetical protein